MLEITIIYGAVATIFVISLAIDRNSIFRGI